MGNLPSYPFHHTILRKISYWCAKGVVFKYTAENLFWKKNGKVLTATPMIEAFVCKFFRPAIRSFIEKGIQRCFPAMSMKFWL